MAKKTIEETYQNQGLEEWRRLAKDSFHRLEFETTLYFLKKYLPEKGLILDAGGGPGRYTIELAKSGYQVVLLDLTPKLLEIAKRQIAKAKVKNNVKKIVRGSIIDLSRFKNNTFDAVICLGGPLSHVEKEEDRQKAVNELIRVAKKGTPIFISVMGRLGMLIESPRYWPKEVEMTKHFRELWQDGDDHLWLGYSYCHFFLPEEFERLLKRNDAFILEKIGLEGLAHTKKEMTKLENHYPTAWKNWLEAHHKLCNHPAVFATSDHMLIIARKK